MGSAIPPLDGRAGGRRARLRYPRGPLHEDMIEERRAGFESVGHTGDIDLCHQIVGKISMQVGPVRAHDETVGLGKIRLQ